MQEPILRCCGSVVVHTQRRIIRMRDEGDALFFQEFHSLASPAAHSHAPRGPPSFKLVVSGPSLSIVRFLTIVLPPRHPFLRLFFTVGSALRAIPPGTPRPTSKLPKGLKFLLEDLKTWPFPSSELLILLPQIHSSEHSQLCNLRYAHHEVVGCSRVYRATFRGGGWVTARQERWSQPCSRP